MSIKENKALMRRFFEITNTNMGNFTKLRAKIDEFYSPGFVQHHTVTGDVNFNQYMQVYDALFTAFPDANYTIDDIIAEGDKVVLRLSMTGTHKSVFQGIPGYDIGNHLYMHVPLFLSPPGDFQNAAPVENAGKIPVEGVAEALDIHPPGIQIWTNRIHRLRSHITIGHIDRVEVFPLCQPGRLQRVFEPHCRLIVGPGNTRTSFLSCHLYGLRRLEFAGTIALVYAIHTRYFPILTVLAVEIASPTTHGKA